MSNWPETLDEHTVVVTSTATLATELRERHTARCLAEGLTSWHSPDVVPFAGWITRLWQQHVQVSLHAPAILLNTQQERALWEQCIATDVRSGEREILQIRGAARHAQNASHLLASWCIRLVDTVLDDDSKAFKGWSRSFSQRLARNHWTTISSATQTLIDWIKQRRLPLPRRVCLAGFDVVAPQVCELIRVLRAVDVDVTELNSPPSIGRASVTNFLDIDEELRAAACWAVQRAAACTGASLEKPLGVIVPDLEGLRAKVVRVFDSVFVSSMTDASTQPRYSLVCDRPLDTEPVVRDALALLTLGTRSIPLATFEQCLRSPYFGNAAEELGLRSLAVASLRSLAETELSLVMWLQQLSSRWPESGLTAGVNGLFEFINNRPGWQSPSAWARTFSNDLSVLGWPGGIGLSETEGIAVGKFESLFDDLSALSMVLPQMSAAQALGRLRILAGERTISASRSHAPVVVLSPGAAAGFEFEALWVTGMHDGAFPRPPRPNPFLPVRLQRTVQVPHSSVQWELDWAVRNVDRWQRCATTTIFSYPREAGDRRLRVSPLVADFAVHPGEWPDSQATDHRYAAFEAARIGLEVVFDAVAPSVDSTAGISGGVGIFKAQAACPFQAFALYRLSARGLGDSGPGLDPIARGSLSHDVLESVWGLLKTQSALLVMPETELDALVDEAVSTALRNWRERRPQTLRGRFERMEHERQKSLVLAWLDIEKERSTFVVEFSEQQSEAVLGGLPIRIRPDRLDRVENGYLIIDYKSGAARVVDWLDERLDEPQLPVYCIAIDDTREQSVVGVSFGLVGAGETRYHGLAGADGLAPGIGRLNSSRSKKLAQFKDWDDLKRAWRKRLEALGIAFRRGDARVQPKTAQTCRSCELKTLCRIHERDAFRNLEDDDS